MGDGPEAMAERVEYLRERGVQIEFPEDRVKAGVAVASNDEPPFVYVHCPVDVIQPVKELKAIGSRTSDVLTTLLAPKFADTTVMDDATVEREAASRLKGMMASSNSGLDVKAPSAATIHELAAGGACEAYPLAQPSSENGWRSVKLYIDEIGALRGRPRNKRAEDLAAAAGLAGLSIHGDAFVGRSVRSPDGLGEHNVDFTLADMAPNSDWCAAARGAHARAAVERGHGDTEHLAGGGDEKVDPYAWSQTQDEVEVRVSGAPDGKGAGKRVKVTFGRGESLSVTVDGLALLTLDKLFARVSPDGCSWSLDGTAIVITMEKMEERAWAKLTLSK